MHPCCINEFSYLVLVVAVLAPQHALDTGRSTLLPLVQLVAVLCRLLCTWGTYCTLTTDGAYISDNTVHLTPGYERANTRDLLTPLLAGSLVLHTPVIAQASISHSLFAGNKVGHTCVVRRSEVQHREWCASNQSCTSSEQQWTLAQS
jgi:hypothetical protein